MAERSKTQDVGTGRDEVADQPAAHLAGADHRDAAAVEVVGAEDDLAAGLQARGRRPSAVRMPESPTPPFSGERPVVQRQASPMTSMSATVMPTSPAVTYAPSREATRRP